MKVKHILKLIKCDCNIIDNDYNIIADTSLDIQPYVLELKVSGVYSNKHWSVQNSWVTIETNKTLMYFVKKLFYEKNILKNIYNFLNLKFEFKKTKKMKNQFNSDNGADLYKEKSIMINEKRKKDLLFNGLNVK